MTKKISIIGIAGVPGKYGGFETLIENILEPLVKDFSITVYCQKSLYPNSKLDEYKGAKLKYLKINANGFSSIFYDIVSILLSFKKSDVLLILGVSGTIILPIIKPFFKGEIIINIDGLEWKREKWNIIAKRFLKISEKIGVRYSDHIISDNYHIQKYVQDEYNKDSFLIEYGGDHVQLNDNFIGLANYSLQKYNYIFTVCRIEPENNLDMMISAYLDSNLEIPYLIVGNFNSSKYGILLREKYGHHTNLILHDAIYDQKKLDQLRCNSFYYLHGHSAGGTNPSLVEAMYLGLPIIAYGVSYNRATTDNKAVYFNSNQELKKVFDKLEEIDRDKLQDQMRLISRKKYTWQKIYQGYKEVFSKNI